MPGPNILGNMFSISSNFVHTSRSRAPKTLLSSNDLRIQLPGSKDSAWLTNHIGKMYTNVTNRIASGSRSYLEGFEIHP
jgi:hypothetical protein